MRILQQLRQLERISDVFYVASIVLGGETKYGTNKKLNLPLINRNRTVRKWLMFRAIY